MNHPGVVLLELIPSPGRGERCCCWTTVSFVRPVSLSGSHLIHRIDGFDCRVVQVDEESNPFCHPGVVGCYV